MASTNIKSVSVGNILIQSGNGYPTHLSLKGSFYTDLDTATQYINKNGLNDWSTNIDSSNINVFVSGITSSIVTGGTFNNNTDTLTFTNSTGGSFTVTGITDYYTTGGTFINNNLILTNNSGSSVTTLINNFSGITVNGNINANAFVTNSGTTNQFVKGDGSLDSTIYENAANKQNSMIFDGSGIKFPTVDAVNTQSNNLLIPNANTGFIDRLDPFTMVLTNPTTITITGSNPGALIRTRLFAAPLVPLDAIRNISGRTFSVSSITLPSDGRFYRYLGYDYSTDSIINSTTSFVTSDNIVALGFVEVFSSGSTKIFTSFQMQVDISTVTLFDNVMVSSVSTANIFPNTGLTVNNNFGGLLKANAINWGQLNPHVRNIPAINPIPFVRINPSYLTTPTGFDSGTTVDTTTYWNGSALVSTGNNNSATIQRWLMCLDGRIFLQAAEQTFTKFSDAIAAVKTVQFTDIIPSELIIELCRMVALKPAINLSDVTQVQFFYGEGGGSSGGGAASFGTIGGSPYDNLLLGIELNNKFSISGGTVNGGITANTISATTYQNLPLDIRVSGMTFNQSNYDLIVNRNDGVSFTQNLGILSSDMTITGGTYNVNTGVVTFTNNSGGTFNVTGFTSGMTDSYTTSAILSGNSISFNNNLYGNNFYNVNLLPLLSGKTNNTAFTAYTATTTSSLNNKYDKSGGTVTGIVTANSFIKVGGTNLQYLMADGSVSLGGGGSSGSTGTTLQTAYNNSLSPQITVTDSLSAFTIQNARATDSSTVQEWKNMVGNTVASIDGSGSFSATTISATTYLNLPLNTKVDTATTLNINGVVQDLSTNREWRTAQGDTGVLSFGGLSSASTTTINVGPITGYIIDNETNPLIPTYTYIDYSGQTGVNVSTRLTGQESFVFINSASTITFQNNFPTSTDRKNKIWLGKISHPVNLVTLVIDEPDYITSPMGLTRDFYQKISYINEGVFPYANGANLNINITGGKIGGNGINFVNNKTNPNELSMGPGIAQGFIYRTQTGGTSTGVTLIDPTRYDLAGTATLIGGGPNASTIQYIFAIPGKGYVVQYGQNIYNTLTEAIGAIGRETFTPYPNLIKNTILIGVLALKKSATALNDLIQAQFFRADLFGGIIGSTAGVAVSTLQTAYNNSLVPQIVVTDALGALTIQNGRASNVSNIIVGQNIAGINTFSVNGNGNITGTTFVKSGGTSSQFLMADGSVSIVGGNGTVVGTGTTNTVSKWISLTGQGNSNITDNGTIITLNSDGRINGNLGLQVTPTPIMRMVIGGVLSGGTITYGILNQPTVSSGVTNTAYYNRTFAQTEDAPFTLSNLIHNFASQGTFGTGSSVTTQYGFLAESSLSGATSNIGFRSNIISNTGNTNWNVYANGTAPNYFAGNVGIGITTPIGKLDINTATGNTFNAITQTTGSISIGNLSSGGVQIPAIFGKSFSGNTGILLMGVTSEVNLNPDMRFEIRENDNSDFSDRTTSGFEFTRFGTTLVNILRNGNTGIGTSTPNDKLEVNGNIRANGFIKTGSTATDILLGNGGSISTNTFHQLRGSYGAGGENIDNLITSGNWLLSTLSTGTKPTFTIRNFVVIKSQEPASSFITQVAYADTTGRQSVRTSTDIGVTWSPWSESFYGSGTTNTVSKWTGQFSQGNSNIVDTGTNVAINSYAYTPLNFGVGGTHGTSIKLNVTGTISGGTSAYGIFNQGTVSSGVTTAAYYHRTLSGLDAGANIGTIVHNYASQGTFGSGSSVTAQFGFYVAATLIGADNNYGLRSSIPSNTGGTNWNTYIDGTAPNYFASDIRVGTNFQSSGAVMTLRSDDVILALRGLVNGTTIAPKSRKISWFSNSGSLEAGSIDVPDSSTSTNAVPMIFTTKDSSAILTEKMRIAVGGSVGIGTDTPIGKFNVVTGLGTQTFNMVSQELGSISFNNNGVGVAQPTIAGKSDNSIGLTIVAGTNETNASPDMRFNVRENDNTDFTGLTSTAFRFDRFSTTLIDVLRNGNVGIGVTSPITKLEVVDTSAATQVDVITLGNNSLVAGTEAGLFLRPTTASSNSRGVRISALQNGSNNIDLLFSLGGGLPPTEKMRITSNGNLGIGIIPTSKLHMFGTDATVYSESALADGHLKVQNNYTAGTNGAQATLALSSSSNGGTNSAVAIISVVQPTNASNASDMTFKTRNAGNITSEAMRITSTGNVGIGTDTPVGKLNVFTGSANTFNMLTQEFGSISLCNPNNQIIPIIAGKSDNNTGLLLVSGTIEGNSQPDMRFDIRTTGGTDFTGVTSVGFRFARNATSLMDILRNGNVGIGTSTPSRKLTVNTDLGIIGTGLIPQLVVVPNNSASYDRTQSSKTFVHNYATVLGSVLTIPIISQGSINTRTMITCDIIDGGNNSNPNYSSSFKISINSLNTTPTIFIMQSLGNIASITASGSNVLVNFTSPHNAANSSITIDMRVLTSNELGSVNYAGITVN